MQIKALKVIAKVFNKKIHLSKDEPLKNIFICNNEIYINGKKTEIKDLKDLVVIYRIMGLL